MADIVMPRLSDTMEEGTILRWLKRDGERVRRGEELVEIETDKASMTYESDQEGVLEIVAGEGDTLAIGAVIAHVASAAAELAGACARSAHGDDALGHRLQPAPAADGHAREPTPPPAAHAPAAASTAPADTRESERVKASPLAKRVARETGIALEGLAGSGPGGRDREGRRAGRTTATAAPRTRSLRHRQTAGRPRAAGALARGRDDCEGRGDGARAHPHATADRPAHGGGQGDDPALHARSEIDMEDCVAAARRAQADRADPSVPTYNDMVVKASALALREHPRVNASYRDGRMSCTRGSTSASPSRSSPRTRSRARSSFPRCSTPTSSRSARSRGRREGSRSACARRRSLRRSSRAARSRSRTSGCTACGASPRSSTRRRRRSSRWARSRRARSCATARSWRATRWPSTLACDHRILYGADAARFLARVRELLEQPAALTL